MRGCRLCVSSQRWPRSPAARRARVDVFCTARFWPQLDSYFVVYANWLKKTTKTAPFEGVKLSTDKMCSEELIVIYEE